MENSNIEKCFPICALNNTLISLQRQTKSDCKFGTSKQWSTLRLELHAEFKAYQDQSEQGHSHRALQTEIYSNNSRLFATQAPRILILKEYLKIYLG